jgi:tRNA pseudouridine38-40 synthase
MMRTLILLIEYDGGNYAGWQYQANALTIQECIENALGKIVKYPVRIIGAGRTDAGVHARGQVAHAIIPDDFPVPEEKIAIALNSNLPGDIRIGAAKIVDEDFHARFDAIAREYSYNLITKESVFSRHFRTFYKYHINTDILVKSADIFIGKHDFTTFSKFNEEYKNYTCNVEKCYWEQINQDYWILTIKSDRFVYGMVRSLVGAMLDAARGKRSIDELKNALSRCDRSLASQLAPPQGLILEWVYYPEDRRYFGR